MSSRRLYEFIFSKKFLVEAEIELEKSSLDIQDEAMDILKKYSWPGNLRELKSVIKKATLFAEYNTIKPEHIEFILTDKSVLENHEPDQVVPLKDAAKNAEKKTIINALKVTKGNKTRAAKLLKITYRSILSKIKEFGIE